MAKNAYITAMAYVLPETIEENTDRRLLRKTGILRRHICPENMTAADLAGQAAEKLLALGIDRKSVDFLIFCTQSPDYPLPTTACLLQERLQLPLSAGALDFNLGCSGYVYGLGLAKGLIETGQAKNVLLLTAETYSKYIHPEDHATRFVFGDAATATLLAATEADTEGLRAFVYGSDGSGAGKLIVPVGGMRHRLMDTAEETVSDEHGNMKTNRNLYMDGAGIMNFALDTVPGTLDKILGKAELHREDVDCYVFHQANRFMLNYLQQKCGLMECPYWNDVEEYGNTVSNSIPIALVDLLRSKDKQRLQNVLLIGFGVGLSWGGCVVDLSRIQENGMFGGI